MSLKCFKNKVELSSVHLTLLHFASTTRSSWTGTHVHLRQEKYAPTCTTKFCSKSFSLSLYLSLSPLRSFDATWAAAGGGNSLFLGLWRRRRLNSGLRSTGGMCPEAEL